MKEISATFTSKGQLVVPAELRRKHGIGAGTRVKLLEDEFGRIVLQPITETYIDRVMGCLADGPDLGAKWKEEHRRESKREERKRKS
jgi:AbrB family looped-hinge helix DNA binding protein